MINCLSIYHCTTCQGTCKTQCWYNRKLLFLYDVEVNFMTLKMVRYGCQSSKRN